MKLPNSPGYVDLLDEDKPIAGQKFACLSFVSPEKIIKHKESFFFDEFVKQWELSKSMERFTQFLAFLSHKYSLTLEDLNSDLQEFAEVEKDQLFKNSLTLNDEYKTFLDNNSEKLQEMYDKENSFRTSTRGVKIRGCFPSQEEAELRAKTLRAVDSHHDIMVGPVGLWLPFDPDAYKTGRTEYLEAELNQLMHEKKKNEKKATDEFESRIRDAKEKAMKDNVEKAKASGNKLTQTLDEAGNLVSANDVTTFAGGLREDDNLSAEEVRDKLFNQPNVLTSGSGGKTIIDIGEPTEDKAEQSEDKAEQSPDEPEGELEDKAEQSEDKAEQSPDEPEGELEDKAQTTDDAEPISAGEAAEDKEEPFEEDGSVNVD